MAHHEDTGHQRMPRREGPDGSAHPGEPAAYGTPHAERTGESGTVRSSKPKPGRHRREAIPLGYESVVARLAAEFRQVHPPETVIRCVAAARYGAQDVTGSATQDQVERIARKHLLALAVVAAERRQQGTLRNAAS